MWALGGVAFVAVVVLIVSLRSHQLLVRRLDELAARADPDGIAVSGNAERALVRIERGVERAAEVAMQAAAAARALASALDRLPHGVVVLDAEGHELAANRAAREMTGTHHGDAIVAEAVESLGAAARAGAVRERVLELVGPPRRTVTVRAVPFPSAGGLPGALVFVEDVTERQRLEDVRTDFVANVSHELKTPIGALALLAETLVDEQDPAVVRRLSDKIVGEAHRAGSMIADLIELSRIEGGEQPASKVVMVRRIVNEAVDRVRTIAEQRSITIERSDPAGRLAVTGDRRQLVSAVGNLLENAIHYSDPGGLVELSAIERDGTLEIVVRDHGIGIPSRDLSRVFERFYRVDRARSRDTGGTGLGLAIVRHAAENHGGSVQVESVEGEGSVFTLRIPISDANRLRVAEAG